MKTDKIPTGMGACSDPQFGARGRARVTARADASFKWVLMSGVLKEGANDTASFVIDNFKIQR
jgi:hypothetical protein